MPTIDDGRNAIEQGNLQGARLIFEAILQETPRSEDAWLGLAEVLTDSEDKRICYENVLKINKTNQVAKEGLRNLEPQANPFVQALGTTGPEAVVKEKEDFGSTADETMVSARMPTDAKSTGPGEAITVEDGPPTYALVAIGLALSVVVFAVGGGLVYLLLSSISGS